MGGDKVERGQAKMKAETRVIQLQIQDFQKKNLLEPIKWHRTDALRALMKSQLCDTLS